MSSGVGRILRGALSTVSRSTKGKPDIVKIPGRGEVAARPIKEIDEAAERYMRKIGRPGEHQIDEYPAFDEENAARIAEEFERMKHDPRDPKVRQSYDAMIDETLDQYRQLSNDLDIRFLEDGMQDPYAASPALGYVDLVENGRLWTFPTDQGFGNDISGFTPEDNPLLKRVGRIGNKRDAVANDAFRVVHDLYGHFGPGNPFFRHQGEERAWLNHSRMYSPEARGAMTSETRGQNSWLNFGPHGERNRKASGADTIFADQKIGLMPEWTMDPKPRVKKAEGGMVDEEAPASPTDAALPAASALTGAALVGGALRLLASRGRRGGADVAQELGVFGGRNAKKAPLDDMAVAYMRRKALTGDDHGKLTRDQEREIWRETGAGFARNDAPGIERPMFEIDDSQARFIRPADDQPRRENFATAPEYYTAWQAWKDAGGTPMSQRQLKVRDVLDHPELHENYPDIADMPVRMRGDLNDMYGMYERDAHGNRAIHLNANRPDDEILGTTLHEVQHAVQDIEDFPRGTSLDAGKALNAESWAQMEKLDNVRNIKEAMEEGLSDEEIIELAQKTGAITVEDPQILPLIRNVPIEEIDALLEAAHQRHNVFRGSGHDVYQRFDGEVMARNTGNKFTVEHVDDGGNLSTRIQGRRGLNADQRRRYFWKDTEDRQGEPRIPYDNRTLPSYDGPFYED